MRSFTELVGRSSSICLQDKFPKNVVNSRNNIWWQIIEIFYSNSNFYPPPLYFKKWIYTAFMRAARAARLFKSKNYMHVELVYKPFFANKYKSFLSQPSFFLHPIWDFYCNSTKNSIFRHFLPYVRCKKWSKIFLKQNDENRLDNFFHYIFFMVFSCILCYAMLYPRTSKVLPVWTSKKDTLTLCTISHISEVLTKGQHVLTIYFFGKFDVQKCIWTFSGLNIFIRTKDTTFWSLQIFCFWKKEKVPVVLLDERVKIENLLF